MFSSITLVLISAAALFIILLLFRAEEKRSIRFLNGPRTHIDFLLLKIRHTFNVRLRAWGRYFIRQILHYFVHTFITGVVSTLSHIEKSLILIARSNKALARKSEHERTSRNKLEEIALHKMEVSLTEEEKRIRRTKSLEE